MEQDQTQTATPSEITTEAAETQPAATQEPPPESSWPAVITERPYELVTLPSGAQVRVERQVTYGELLVASILSLVLVVQLGRWLWERIRGVL